MSFRRQFLETRGGPLFKIEWGANNRIFCKTVSEKALIKVLVILRPSMVYSPNFIGKHNIFLLFLNWWFVENGRTGTDWSCGMISRSTTGLQPYKKASCGLWFGGGEMLGSGGLTVHMLINTSVSWSDTWESVFLSVSWIRSSDLL